MHPNVRSCPLPPWLGTRLFSRMAFSSPAVHSTSRFGGICSSCPKFSPIHTASFVGSQRVIGWDLLSDTRLVTRATLAPPAGHHLHRRHLAALEAHPSGLALGDARPSTPCQYNDGMHRCLLFQHMFFFPEPVYHI